MSLQDCRIIDLPKVEDPRGNLSFIESGRHVNFDIKRIYYLYDIPGGSHRGGHAHKSLHQLLIAMSGSFDILLHDGNTQFKYHMSRPNFGLYIPPMIWREIDNFSGGSVCLVLASECFSEDDYYRVFDDFVQGVSAKSAY